jgi:hypothetical protein
MMIDFHINAITVLFLLHIFHCVTCQYVVRDSLYIPMRVFHINSLCNLQVKLVITIYVDRMLKLPCFACYCTQMVGYLFLLPKVIGIMYITKLTNYMELNTTRETTRC